MNKERDDDPVLMKAIEKILEIKSQDGQPTIKEMIGEKLRKIEDAGN